MDRPALIDRGLEYVVVASLTLRFVVRVGERTCCEVRTTYVCTDHGTPSPWPDEVRALVSAS